MAQTRTIPVFGKVVTPVGDYYLTSPEDTRRVVQCRMDQGRYPAPVQADFTHVQHVIARFDQPIQIEVDFGRISA